LLEINRPIDSVAPNPDNRELYQKILQTYQNISEFQSDIADYRKKIGI
jgi:hypothetical protein